MLREAGARVAPQPLLRDLDLAIIAADDGRRVDVVAYDLPLFGGVPVCGDATLVSPLHCDGTPRRGADTEAGLALRAARRRKELVYLELVNSAMAKFILFGHEVGGRWAPDGLRLLAQLARGKIRHAPALLRHSARAAWHWRWLGSHSMASQSALAASLAGPAALLTAGQHVPVPEESKVVIDFCEATTCSRLPLR